MLGKFADYLLCRSQFNMYKFPIFIQGEIVKGFGRGSKELGIPTANFDLNVVSTLPAHINTGIYYGWANVDKGEVFKMVLSIGWNPFYKNTHKSMETHIIHDFGRDFYGSLLKVAIVGYLRPEKNFEGLESLIIAIRKDISDADRLLNSSENLLLKNHDFFTT